MFERIEIYTGASPALCRAQTALACVAGGLLLTASLDPLWVGCALCGLLASLVVANRETRRQHPGGRVVIRGDGSLQSRDPRGECYGTLAGDAWVSRRLCVFSWKDGRDRTRRSLVMASNNHSDDYRRLRVVLRLGAGGVKQ